jgi:hypothetical protein
MTTDKIEETIKEIAAKHGIAVGRDDPILILQTINERLMQDSAAAQQEILDHFKEEMEAIAHRWGDDAKNKAERTLNGALTASREAMMETMQEGSKVAAESLRRELESTTTRLASSVRESRSVAIMNLVAACMTVFAVVFVLWVLM